MHQMSVKLDCSESDLMDLSLPTSSERRTLVQLTAKDLKDEIEIANRAFDLRLCELQKMSEAAEVFDLASQEVLDLIQMISDEIEMKKNSSSSSDFSAHLESLKVRITLV